jgi:hypothetical protein
MMLIYPTDHIESITALMVECVGYIVCGDRWADLVVWGYGLTVPTRNRRRKSYRTDREINSLCAPIRPSRKKWSKVVFSLNANERKDRFSGRDVNFMVFDLKRDF